ncbi:alpha-amylase family glycosyl hydrolase [Chelativorans sp. AA-79]|uniref:alpha-amylase family glycosyl hydrolase n=1 Tax=Chelativorans sp. AA-79 TaxID=3028735 RepID=UPI0023F83952|nr:alpha-amylase family glycosyl hydrolase [Chelativorans sp. AA-79]WEX09535.1 alpha-amylase family glycosyl hydrolase [Chelativorans sp. AA-79]
MQHTSRPGQIAKTHSETEPWWQRGVIYQVYPRSFQDSDGDGIGDLRGIIDRLDYLVWLGVDAIWVSPIFPSPMADFGYDIADYRGIDPRFGTVADFDRLLLEAHRRGLRVLLDFVPNHTSDRHPWFLESRSSRQNPRRDFYLWHDAAPDGGPPNNWRSEFGGSAWQWDEHTGQYYYHAFLKEQPDLNWRNPQVRREMYDILRFWLDKGVDGFRVDVMWHLIKDAEFRDNPPNPDWTEEMPPHKKVLPLYSTDQPEVHEVVSEMRGVLEEYGSDRLLIGEIYLPVARLVGYYGRDLRGAHLPFNFHLIQAQWDARHIERQIAEYEAALPEGGWPNWVLSNHDKPRIAARVGRKQARVAAMMLLTLRGTPTIYYGDEIGMDDVPIPADRVQDPFERRVPGKGFGRDPQRTPMQWDRGANAGFTIGSPWLPLASDRDKFNVEAEREDPRSVLALYRRLLGLRRKRDALAIGRYAAVQASGNMLAYLRETEEERYLVALNLGAEPAALELPGPCRILVSTENRKEGEPIAGKLDLAGNEGVLAEMAE